MAGLVEKPQQIVGAYRGCERVVQWMEVKGIRVQEALLEDDCHNSGGVVDDGERCDGAGDYSQIGVEAFRTGEPESPGAQNLS